MVQAICSPIIFIIVGYVLSLANLIDYVLSNIISSLVFLSEGYMALVISPIEEAACLIAHGGAAGQARVEMSVSKKRNNELGIEYAPRMMKLERTAKKRRAEIMSGPLIWSVRDGK